MELKESVKKELISKSIRKKIFNIENSILENKNPNYKTFTNDTENCPLKHYFSDGIYVREIFIPKGMVITEQKGEEIIEGPCFMMSEPGTKRALYSVTDLVWTTIHHNPTNTEEISELEDMVIAKNYDEYNKFIKTKDGVVNKIKNKIIKILSV